MAPILGACLSFPLTCGFVLVGAGLELDLQLRQVDPLGVLGQRQQVDIPVAGELLDGRRNGGGLIADRALGGKLGTQLLDEIACHQLRQQVLDDLRSEQLR